MAAALCRFRSAFYERLKATGLHAKVCWDAECQHLENDVRPIMTWDHWPESWETTDLTAYRAGFLTGREACQWIVDALNGPDSAALWGLSDGDIAWWCYDALARTAAVGELERCEIDIHPYITVGFWTSS